MVIHGIWGTWDDGLIGKFLENDYIPSWELFVLWIKKILGCCFALWGKTSKKEHCPQPNGKVS